MPVPASYLLILGEREALAWVLRQQRMAFAEHRSAEAARLREGDRLFLYTTRGCFHNPTRDRSRIIGIAQVVDPVTRLPRPLRLSGRLFSSGCRLKIDRLAPYRLGLEVAPLVKRLDAFPDPATWSLRVRRTLLRLSDSDARLLEARLERFLVRGGEALDEYLRATAQVAATRETVG